MAHHQSPPGEPAVQHSAEWADPHKFFLALIVVALAVGWLPQFLVETFHIIP